MEETETVLTLADFGALLRERRIHKGLTEENVAAELKITSRLVKACLLYTSPSPRDCS